ncbi:MAG: sugar ABC transporter permease [Candidatus Competibacterales bacterium]|nr:sugar ABC transporter permease [Candidatus Competibacterales bacterium]
MSSDATKREGGRNWWESVERQLPKLVVAPTFIASLVFVYGFIGWTTWLSLSKSTMMPNYDWAGLAQYARLFRNDRWWVAAENLFIFGLLFIGFAMVIGLLLAIFLDQRIRAEGAIRTIYLYPMALSLIVTGVVWQWMLNPGLGLERVVQGLGFESFQFDWLVNPDRAIYTIVIAAVWQSSGFVMALFLAGLRGIDDSVFKAAQVDGASLPKIYWRIVIPCLRPVFFSALVILAHIAIKSFDLIKAMTDGGPGYATDVPATFMYTFAYTRGQLGVGAAAAMMMLMAVLALVVPYIYSELRGGRRD